MTKQKETIKDRVQAAAKTKGQKTKVQAKVNLVRVGLSYFAGDIFEIDAKVAKELMEDGLVKSA